MAKKGSTNNADPAEPLVNKEVAAVDLAILSNIIAMLSQIIGLFSLVLQAEAIQEAENEKPTGATNEGANNSNTHLAISPERFKKLEKQVMYLSKEMERLKK